MMSCYQLIKTMTKLKVKSDHRSKFSNLSNWKEEAWKKESRLQRDSNQWPPRYRCDALPTELWSHTSEARSIYWVHIFPCSEMIWSLYEIIHICIWSLFTFIFNRSTNKNLLRWSLFTFSLTRIQTYPHQRVIETEMSQYWWSVRKPERGMEGGNWIED